MEIRNCDWCGKEFISRRHDNRFCSPNCAYESQKKRQREHYEPKLHSKVCQHCGDVFVTRRSLQIFCCEDCRKADKRERQFTIHMFKCIRCGKEFNREETPKFKICPECRKNAIDSGEVLLEKHMSDINDDDRFIIRYSDEDRYRAEYHSHLISADERKRRSIGIPSKSWGAYKEAHKEVMEEIRLEAAANSRWNPE